MTPVVSDSLGARGGKLHSIAELDQYKRNVRLLQKHGFYEVTAEDGEVVWTRTWCRLCYCDEALYSVRADLYKWIRTALTAPTVGGKRRRNA